MSPCSVRRFSARSRSFARRLASRRSRERDGPVSDAARSRGGVIVRAQRRFRARRRAGSRRTRRRAIILGAVVALLGLGGWFLANSSLFALRYVTVEGTSRLTVAQVLDAAHVQQSSSLVRLRTGAIARRA